MSLMLRRQDNLPEFSSIFDRFFNSDLFDWSTRNFSDTNTTLPAVNVVEDEEKYMVEMAAPGMKRDDFKVELHNNQLRISSERQNEESDEDRSRNYSRREFSYQSFMRSFSLPETVDPEKIEAKYDAGILKLILHKREEAKPKPAKLIKIK